MPNVTTHNRKTKSGKLIQVSSHARAGEQKAKSPTMRTEARAVVDKPDKPNKSLNTAQSNLPNFQQKGVGNDNQNDLLKKYKTGLQILVQLIVNLGGIEKARENEQYKELIKIMANRFKELQNNDIKE